MKVFHIGHIYSIKDLPSYSLNIGPTHSPAAKHLPLKTFVLEEDKTIPSIAWTKIPNLDFLPHPALFYVRNMSGDIAFPVLVYNAVLLVLHYTS